MICLLDVILIEMDVYSSFGHGDSGPDEADVEGYVLCSSECQDVPCEQT